MCALFWQEARAMDARQQPRSHTSLVAFSILLKEFFCHSNKLFSGNHGRTSYNLNLTRTYVMFWDVCYFQISLTETDTYFLDDTMLSRQDRCLGRNASRDHARWWRDFITLACSICFVADLIKIFVVRYVMVVLLGYGFRL